MSDKYFLDTDIFLYCFAQNDTPKKEKANELIRESLISKLGMISFQVILEFNDVITRKTAMKIAQKQAYATQVLFPLWEVQPTDDLYMNAIRIQHDLNHSFNQALIISAALAGRCKKLYSSEIPDGHKIQSLAIVNPFDS